MEGRWEMMRTEVDWRSLWKPLLGELMACFFINFLGCSAAISTDAWGHTLTKNAPDTFSLGDTYQIATSLAFGFTVCTMFAMFQHISGGHANPAVTIGLMLRGRFYVLQGLIYLPIQLGGSVLGSGFLRLIMGNMNAGRTDVFPTLVQSQWGVEIWQGVIWEVLNAFILTIMYLVVTDDAYPYFLFTGPLLLGVVVTSYNLATLYATGASGNPTRSLGAAIISNEYRDIWIYIVCPPVGACLAAGFHYLVMNVEPYEEDVLIDT